MASRRTFSPEWASAPGETIKDVLDERGIAAARFADMLGEPPELLHDLFIGSRPITIELARRLRDTLGGSVEFWMQRDLQYRADSERFANEAWLRKLPLKDMVQYGWLPGEEGIDPLSACLDFFGVDSVRQWSHLDNHLLRGVALRASESYPSEGASLAAWLRRGEVVANGMPTGSWDPVKVEQAIVDSRVLTREQDPQRFLPALQERFGPYGLTVVAERAPSGCRASGAAWFRSNDQAVVLLSFRYLSDDHFWFTFFHEVAHLILHGDERVYVDNEDDVESQQETEANQYAQRVLVPLTARRQLQETTLSHRALIRFARDVGVSPGVVVGQLQYEGRVPRDHFNDLKRGYHWSEPSVIRAGRV
jgi:HTH-type transcriptional regulator/antitoxin HigA